MRWTALALVLGPVSLVGCYRSTGIQRNPMVAETIPETGGDRVTGLKYKAGSGCYYLGNDFVQVAVDSAVYGDSDQAPLAGALSGGSIVDAGHVLLDSSYNRVSAPGNAMHRLTPVVNQDPTVQAVFTSYTLENVGDHSSISMTGKLLDPNNTLGTGSSPVAGVTVSHSLSVGQLDRFVLATTTVTNTSGAALPIYTIGDLLLQQGGGYHFNIPANFDWKGQTLPTSWGVQIPSYTNFSNPLRTSVQAPLVALMDTEPGANTLDSHAGVGFLPVDNEQLLVASDPQDMLTLSANLRPDFPARLVVGSLPTSTALPLLANGASLTFRRRIYIIGGRSVDTNLVTGLAISADYPNQANALLNQMDEARYNDTTVRPVRDFGTLVFSTSGSAVRQGPRPVEIRIERNVSPTPDVPATAVWQVQRVEWFEPNENLVTTTALAPSTLKVRLPTGIYRMVLRNEDNTQVRTLFENTTASADDNATNTKDLPGPIWIQNQQTYTVSTQDVLDPDAAAAAGDPNLEGAINSNSYSLHYIQTREANSINGNLQPLRITLKGANSAPDPVLRRTRALGSYYDADNRKPQVASGSLAGQYQFRAGNELFGTGFNTCSPAEYLWLKNGYSYTAYGTRGPLSYLQSLTLTAFDGQAATSHTFTVTPKGLPSGWTSFDVPGPSQATTGGYLPAEKLASAMANGVQVVGDVEEDLIPDGVGLYNDFMTEFWDTNYLSEAQRPASLSAMDRPSSEPCGNDPYVVGGRSTFLNGFGEVASLFTPNPSAASLGGALPSSSWTLADFLAQGGGSYNVVLRPRGSNGLFALKGTPTLGDSGSWWNQAGSLSFGKTNGGFDALELLRGEGFDGTAPDSWFTEFKQVRTDWFALLNQQTPTQFTKALGLSSAAFSYDTPVGLARTYLKASVDREADNNGNLTLSSVLSALQSGAAVASTGPFLDVAVGSVGPGGLVSGPVTNVNLTVNLWKTDWMPVDEVRVIVNGALAQTAPLSAFSATGSDSREYAASFSIPMASLVTPGRDGWIVVEAGVPLGTTGVYAPGTPWNAIMRGIYPIAVTNPIFVSVTGNSTYLPPVH